MQGAEIAPRKWYRNIPNILTVLRVLLIIPMAVLFLNGARLLSLLFFLLAGMSDILDGFLARRLHIISNFGKIMDPVADKLMLLTIVVCLFAVNDLPDFVIAAILGKEMIMLLGGGILLKYRIIIPANRIGKIGTVLFSLAVVLAFLKEYTAPWYLYTMYAAVVFSLFSLGQYTVNAVRLFKNRTLIGKEEK